MTAGPIGVLAPGTFFDAAPVHLLLGASLRALERLVGDAATARFRPNLVLDGDGDGFVEEALVGRDLAVGPELVLRIVVPTPRCIVPTLPIADLPPAPGILRALAAHHRVPVGGSGRFACFGVYASVALPGRVRVGDEVAPIGG